MLGSRNELNTLTSLFSWLTLSGIEQSQPYYLVISHWSLVFSTLMLGSRNELNTFFTIE